MGLRELGKQGLRYLLWYVAVTAVLSILRYFWPAIAEASIGFAVTASAAGFTLDGFIKSHVAIPSRDEYWALVGVSTVVALVVDFAFLLSALTIQGAAPLSLGGWALVSVVALIITMLANIFGYSRVFSKPFLQRRQAKLAKSGPVSNSGS